MTAISLLRSYSEGNMIHTFIFRSPYETWLPGQYQTYRLPQVEGTTDAQTRYFTIASAPSEGVIQLTTRLTGSPFKQALQNLKPGDTIEVSDLDGDFTWQDDSSVVLIAGGIGITPFRSMLIERAATGKSLSAHLLYFSRNSTFAFQTELDELVRHHPELRIEYLVGEPITADTILANAPESAEQITYLSGPEPMVESVGDALKQRGVRLQQDWFPGYTDTTY